jgi:zinc transporter ZupT
VKKDYQKDNRAAAAVEAAMPDAVAVTLAELAGSLREGLLALAVGAGFQVMDALIDESVTALAGPKFKHDPQRRAVRHGTEAGSVVLGGRRVPVRRPRVRAADGSVEVAVPAYELFSSTELLGQMALERMMAKLSTRRYAAGLEPVGQARGRYWSVGDLLRVSVDLLTDGIMIGTGSLIDSSLGFVLALGQVPSDIHRQSRRAGYTSREIAIYQRWLTPKLQAAPAQQAGAASS